VILPPYVKSSSAWRVRSEKGRRDYLVKGSRDGGAPRPWRACPSRLQPSATSSPRLHTLTTFTPICRHRQCASPHLVTATTRLQLPEHPYVSCTGTLAIASLRAQTRSPHQQQPASGLTARYADRFLRCEHGEHTVRLRPEVLPSHTVFGVLARQTATSHLLQGEQAQSSMPSTAPDGCGIVSLANGTSTSVPIPAFTVTQCF
jgi:hypothetical protein